MSDYNQIDGAALDRHITGNYGEDQFSGLLECSKCGGQGFIVGVLPSEPPCPTCKGEGYIEKIEDPGDDPDQKYDEERDRRLLDD